MSQPIIERILRESGMDGLLDLLARRLPPTDLQSLLLAVYRERASHQTSAHVLDQYARNRFVRPASVDLRALLEIDRVALECAAPAFDAIALAPVSPLGTASALGPVDQNSVVSTIRNTEVVSDCTNVLALECAARRRELRTRAAGAGTAVRLCTSHRLLRAQNYNRPGLSAHFQIFALCTAGRAVDGYRFEMEALEEQVACYLDLLAAVRNTGYHINEVRVAFTDLPNRAFLERLQDKLIPSLAARFSNARIECDPDHASAAHYYQLVRFHIYTRSLSGTEHELADGGFTDWTQQLLGDKKERLLTSGISTERICSQFS
jgi:hypothetical protein